MNKRIAWIDNAKFLGIFLVVLGHSSIPTPVINFIYAFHMPLFFFISGYLFNPLKFNSFSAFTLHRFKQIMIPYFFFSAITYSFWLFVGRKFGVDAALEISPTTPLVGIFYGTDTGNYLVHCGSLWFLPCLFITELMCFFAIGKLNKFLMPLLFALVGFINYKMEHTMLPWSFDVAIVAAFFYLSGNLLSSGHQNNKSRLLFSWPAVVISLAILLSLSIINGRSDMSSNTYQSFSLFLVTGLAGICFVCSLSYRLASLSFQTPWVGFFAKNTLILLALHSLADSVLKGIFLFVFKIPLLTFKYNLSTNLLLTCLVFISLVPVIYFLNRFTPSLIGRMGQPKSA